MLKTAMSRSIARRTQFLHRIARGGGIRLFGGMASPILLSVGLAFGCLSAMAQDSWPNKSVRMVVPFAPGGATDLAARAVSERLSQMFGQTIVIDNRAGAGGQVGTVIVAKAPADGYTLLYGASSTMLILPALESNVQFDTVRDFSVAAMAVKLPLLLAASPSLGVTDLKGLRELLKANPEKYSYGSAGAGTTSHVGAAAFAQMIGAPQIVHVPYKGTAPAIVDVLAGRLAYIVDAMGPLGEHIRAGRLVGIAITEKERVPQFPNLPTMAEAGLPEFLNYTWTPWSGIYVPKGTPAGIIERINRDVNRALKEPELLKKLTELGFFPIYASVAESQALVNRESTLWAPLLKTLNIKGGN